jgi:ATP-dependent protease Clp ATPase subunit
LHEECAQLIAGPGVFICDRCVAQAPRLSASAPVKGWAEGPPRLEASESEARCSFCGKDARHGVLLVASGLTGVPGGKVVQDGARICDECLDLCLEILAETSSP